jgi:hypothetical protein
MGGSGFSGKISGLSGDQPSHRCFGRLRRAPQVARAGVIVFLRMSLA